MYFRSYFIILFYVPIFLCNTKEKERKSVFSSSVFIFYDNANKLSLDNEVTNLKFWCLGAIVTPRWILTAATCFKKIQNPNPHRYIVVPTKATTTYENWQDAEPYAVQKIIRHKSWLVKENDGVNIALLLLETSIVFKANVQNASMASAPLRKLTYCRSLTWLKQPSKVKGSSLLIAHVLKGTIDSYCRPKKHYNEFCIVYKVEEGNCYIVQGGLLECNKKLQGIVSSRCGGMEPMCSENENITDFEIRYVDVGSFKKWILSHIKLEESAFKNRQPDKVSHVKSNNNTISYTNIILYLLFVIYLI